MNPLSLLNPAAAVIEAAGALVEGATQGRRAAAGAAPGAADAVHHLVLDRAWESGPRRAVRTVRQRGRNPVLGYATRPAPAPAKKSATSTAATSRKSGDFAFLSDPKLTVEEKLMRLLAALSDRWEKEMQAKMDQIAADENSEAGAASSTKKSGSKSSTSQSAGSGLLGGIGDVFSGILGGSGGGGGGGLLGGLAGGLGGLFGVLGGSGGAGGGGLLGGLGGLLSGVMGGAGGFGGALDLLKDPGVKDLLGKISGPVLAAAGSALGCPMAAPILMQLGPALVDGAASLASAGDQDASATSGKTSGSGSTRSSGSTSTSGSSSPRASSSSSSSSGTSSTSGDKKMSDSQRQLLMMEIQRIYERQKEMFGIVSNILKASHDTRMNAVNNIR